jgi:hypothetical protein
MYIYIGLPPSLGANLETSVSPPISQVEYYHTHFYVRLALILPFLYSSSSALQKAYLIHVRM